MHRRNFLASSPWLLLGAPLAGMPPLPLQSTPKGADLKEELTPEENEIVNRSAMGNDIANYFGKGLSCAESGLMVSLRFLKKPEDLVWFAGGFGGGMNHKDLCGFLTSGIMAVGLYAGTLSVERKEAREICGRKVQEFWQWWSSTAPLHCADIREGRTDFKVCHRLGRLAAARLEELIKPA